MESLISLNDRVELTFEGLKHPINLSVSELRTLLGVEDLIEEERNNKVLGRGYIGNQKKYWFCGKNWVKTCDTNSKTWYASF